LKLNTKHSQNKTKTLFIHEEKGLEAKINQLLRLKVFDFKNSTLEEFWKHVAAHLESKGIGLTLVGGAVATIYSKGAYESGDLDFVFDSMFQDRSKFQRALAEIGIQKIYQRFYKHPDSPFLLESKTPPIEIGHQDNANLEIIKLQEGGQKIKILSPTDCINDRLYKADEYDDDEAFEAALLVAKETGFVRKRVKIFCEENKKLEIFEKFLSLLKQD
jgi:hypothetical protein